jgi:hypothetical protein
MIDLYRSGVTAREVAEKFGGRCCVNRGWAWQGRVVLRSPGEGEFGEGGREPMLWVFIHASW